MSQSVDESGAELLTDVRRFISRFCIFPSEDCLNAVTLWAAHTHLIKDLFTTARLALLSPEAASGKTRVLEVLDLLVPDSLFALNASPASIFRLLSKEQITLLIDETDAIWSKRGKNDDHEDLRALLNAGYKKGATIPRCVGPKHDVVKFNVFCAVALAGLGQLPETIMSRSIVVRMRRRAPNEGVESFNYRRHIEEGDEIKARLQSWAVSLQDVDSYIPEMPAHVVDRPAEVWEPLLVVADKAGREWPELGRAACESLCREASDRRASLGVRLLSDIRTVFGDANAMHSAKLVKLLTTDHERADPLLDPDAPWFDLRGKPLNQRGLASMLREYGVRPLKVRVEGDVLQGYRREDLRDAWLRYLPSLVSGEAEHSEHPELLDEACQRTNAAQKFARSNGAGISTLRQDRLAQVVPSVPDVPDFRTPEGGCVRCDGEGCRWCAA